MSYPINKLQHRFVVLFIVGVDCVMKALKGQFHQPKCKGAASLTFVLKFQYIILSCTY